MLQTIHGGAKKWIIVPLLVLLVLSFVAWGIADVFQGRVANDTVVTVGDVEYSGMQVQQEVQRGMEYLRQMTGGAISMQQAIQYGFVDRTLDSMVERALLQQEARRLGIMVGDEVIMKAIRALPEFQRADGSFDAEAFRSALMRVGASEQIFVNEQRQTLARNQVQQMVKAGIESPDLLNRALAAAAAEERDFDLFRVKFASQPAPATPDDAVLAEYMQENAARFSAPEYRNISVIRLSTEDVAKDVTVTDEQVAEYYATHKSEFEVPEKRSFKQAVLSSQDEAVKLIDTFTLTRYLNRAAKSVDATATELNNISLRELPDELREVAFSLSTGVISQPVQSDIGWHVLQQTAVSPAKTVTLEQASQDIRKNLTETAAQERLYQASAELDDMIAGGTSLEDIATQLRLQLRRAEGVDAKGESLDGTVLGPILGQREVLAEAFKLEQGDQSDVISTPAGDYFVVRVDGVTPSTLRPLAAVRDSVLKAWRAAQQEKAATDLSIKVLDDVKSGDSLQTIASKYGVEASIEKNLTRDEAKLPGYIPGPMIRDLFALKLGDVTQFPDDDAIVIARLAQIHHPISVEDAKPDGHFVEQASESLRNEMFEAYTEGLKQRYPVTVDRVGIDRLFAESEG